MHNCKQPKHNKGQRERERERSYLGNKLFGQCKVGSALATEVENVIWVSIHLQNSIESTNSSARGASKSNSRKVLLLGLYEELNSLNCNKNEYETEQLGHLGLDPSLKQLPKYQIFSQSK